MSVCRVILVIEMRADVEVKYQGPELWKVIGGNILPVLCVSGASVSVYNIPTFS